LWARLGEHQDRAERRKINLGVKAVQGVEVVGPGTFEIVLVLEDERVARVRLNTFTMVDLMQKLAPLAGLGVTGK
jgi:hypothetical protein